MALYINIGNNGFRKKITNQLKIICVSLEIVVYLHIRNP